jgi:SAM-dependent methyltransferase
MIEAPTSVTELRQAIVEAQARNQLRLRQARVRLASIAAAREADALRNTMERLGQQTVNVDIPDTQTEPKHDPPLFLPQSPLAHRLLDGLSGLEIGGAAHNAFGLNAQNVGITEGMEPRDYLFHKELQIAVCGEWMPVDIAGYADKIPVDSDSQDFVIHSHMWEHLANPLGALDEWARVVRSGGYIYAIVPKRDVADVGREVTDIRTHIVHYLLHSPSNARALLDNIGNRAHYTVFDGDSLMDIEMWFNLYHEDAQLMRVAYQETDDKVGNGHAIVWQVIKEPARQL